MADFELTSFRLENFKSFRRAELTLAPLTLVIGTNASGKSNLVEAMQFLRWLTIGGQLPQLPLALKDEILPIRGTPEDLGYCGSETLRVGVSFRVGEQQVALDASFRLLADGWRLSSETLKHGVSVESMQSLYQVAPSPTRPDWVAVVAGEDIDSKGIGLERAGSQLYFASVHPFSMTPYLMMGGVRAGSEMMDLVLGFSARLGFLSPVPERMRDYAGIKDTLLVQDGSNFSSVLHKLCENTAIKAAILEFVSELPERPIANLDFIDTPRHEVMLRLEETFGGTPAYRDAAVLSDGTLRVLAIAASLFGEPEGSLIVIEEIENGLHPSRVAGLLKRIQKIAAQRHLKVLLTTHNATLLNALPLEVIPDVVCCYRDEETGASELVRLADIPSYPQLLGRGPVGRLLEQGLVEQAVHEQETPEARIIQQHAWLDQFQRQMESP